MLKKNYWYFLLLYLVFWLCIPDISNGASQLEVSSNHPTQSEQNLNENIKCGFPLVLQANTPQNKDKLLWLQSTMLRLEQLDSVYMSPSGHFKIHYNNTGYNAIPSYDRNQNNTPDYLEFVAKSFDRAWQIEIDSLGFKPPPDSSGNDRELYPIYCGHISAYGRPLLDYEIPALPGINYVTHIEIHTDFSSLGVVYPGITDPIVRDSMAIAVTAAHEFNHALQMGYRLWPEDYFFYDMWFIESSATYMEEVVAGEVNDYLQYLKYYFNSTRLPLDYSTAGLMDYGKVVFLIMLGELYGKDVTRKVWSGIQQQRALPSLENTLLNLNTDIKSEIVRLALWLYYTNEKAQQEKYFPDAEYFPNVSFDSVSTNPIKSEPSELVSDSLPRLSFQWYLSKTNTPLPQNLLLKGKGNTLAEYLSGIYINLNDDGFFIYPAATGFAIPFDLSPKGLYYSVINAYNTDILHFNFSLLSKPLSVIDRSRVYVYPQPLKLSDLQPRLNFVNIPNDAEILIYSSNGRHLVTLRSSSGSPILFWDLRTQSGEKIGSGVYIFKMKSSGSDYTGKFVVVH